MKRVFISTIQCGGCVSKVTPVLNEAIGIGKWQVDLLHPDRLLTIENCELSDEDIVLLVKQAGFLVQRKE